MTTANAITASSFLNSLGVNTHIDFNAFGYQDLATVESAINYLGLKNIRDSPANPSDLSTWLQVAQATGAKFDAYVGQTSPSGMSTELGFVQQLAQEGILNAVEGGNEEDDAYPASLGNTLAYTAVFQGQVFALGQMLGLPTVNMSFGAGWTWVNNWQGDYGAVGDLSGITDYGNGHVYPNVGQTADAAIQQINGDARLAAASRPVMITELGWNLSSFSQGQVAQYAVQGAFDGIKNGNVREYYYALFGDGSGAFGLMNPDGLPTQAGAAVHNLTSLLADTGSFAPGSLGFTLAGAQAGDNTVLIQKSDGSDWLALWNESAGTHSVTLNLDSTASQILVFDPVTGTSAVAGASNTNSISLSLGNDPLLVEVVGSGGTPSPAPTPTPSAPTPAPSAGGGSSGGTPAASGMSLAVPASASYTAGHPVAISGVQISDAYASSNPATVTANVSDQSGTLSVVDAWGNPQQGASLSLSGTIWQVNAALANLSYAGSGGSDSIAIQVSDSAGNSATQTIAVNGTGGAGAAPTPSAPTPSASAQQIAGDDATPVITASNTAFSASSGDHMIFIAGSGDTLNATGGTETVQAYSGGNTIITGAGNDTIRVAGSGNTIDAGGGNNQIADSGNGNTIVLPGAGQGNDDVFGWTLQNGDTFDLRSLLAQTGWNGDAAIIGNFVQVGMAGDSGVVSVDPSGAGGAGGSYAVATLHASGAMDLSTLLAHAIT